MEERQIKVKAGKFGRGVLWATILTIVLVVGGGVALFWFMRDGNAVAVWYVCVMVALFLLALISMPCGAVVSNDGVEIRSLLRSEWISFDRLVSVRRVHWSSIRRVIPLAGVFGFLGYHGSFYSTTLRSVVMIFARSRHGLAEIRTVDGKRYIFSLAEPEKLINEVDGLRNSAK